MFARRFTYLLRDPVTSSLSSFSLILFFILFADALLSFWIPNFLQKTLGSPFLMGLVMSFSSLIGLCSDLLFPQLLRSYTVRKLLFSAILVSFLFIGSLLTAVKLPLLSIFLVAMAIWGIYYEYLGFATQQFVADSIPLKLRSTGWAIIDIFKNLAYFLGPLAAAWFLAYGEPVFLLITTLFVLIGFLIFTLSKNKHERQLSIIPSEVNLWRELSHWRILFKKVWPLVFLSLFVGLIDATFWTTGAVWTESLSKENLWGAMILPAYQLPALFMGLVVAKWGIYKGKKKLAEKFLLLSGLTLSLLWFEVAIPIYLIIVFLSSVFLAAGYPLIEAVYTDLTSRMGIERKHLVGLSSSTISMAYIVGPAISGLIATLVGERTTFVVVGVLSVFLSLVLLAITPKKLLLPEKEIKTWED